MHSAHCSPTTAPFTELLMMIMVIERISIQLVLNDRLPALVDSRRLIPIRSSAIAYQALRGLPVLGRERTGRGEPRRRGAPGAERLRIYLLHEAGGTRKPASSRVKQSKLAGR